MGVIKNLAGVRFGMVTVIEQDGEHVRGNVRWKAQCDCGREFVTSSSHLRPNGIKSCGCQRQVGRRRHHDYEDIPGWYWKRVISNCVRREIVITITIDEAWAVFERQGGKCAYTGLSLMFARSPRVDCTASIDRIDPAKPYSTDNIQWVHKDINRMKSTLTEARFIELSVLIANYCRP